MPPRVALALALLIGLGAVAVIWGLVSAITTLLVVIAVVGVAGQLLLGGPMDLGRVLVAGGAGAVLGIAVVSVAGLPALVRVGGIPVIWATIGTVAVLLALRSSPATGRR